ncbi:YutD family protein [Paenibacillus sp. J22TS3]|uniref:YutD family protein n=1 Tax=Paenibacillus sp. J22TS3 TaxID=2807192 RepID=UPI001B25AAE4|nr:YutD family protein [Paenibacillus sp. J22TS3]GIP23991.1 hypothetical protein J22TS3_42660 [Paenibacillus sp. J22TS3]
MIQVNGKSYELIQENRNGWDPEAFKQRYSDVLERYDYVIGDWGYNQLRLKGFYRDNHPKVSKDSSISGIMDYINEYCNFGCPYFVLQRVKDVAREPEGAKESVDAKETKESKETKETKETKDKLSPALQSKQASATVGVEGLAQGKQPLSSEQPKTASAGQATTREG